VSDSTPWHAPCVSSLLFGLFADWNSAVSSAQAVADTKFCRRRDPEASPFYKLLTDHFDEVGRQYPQRYGMSRR
jgi:hypothetical protein